MGAENTFTIYLVIFSWGWTSLADRDLSPVSWRWHVLACRAVGAARDGAQSEVGSCSTSGLSCRRLQRRIPLPHKQPLPPFIITRRVKLQPAVRRSVTQQLMLHPPTSRTLKSNTPSCDSVVIDHVLSGLCHQNPPKTMSDLKSLCKVNKTWWKDEIKTSTKRFVHNKHHITTHEWPTCGLLMLVTTLYYMIKDTLTGNWSCNIHLSSNPPCYFDKNSNSTRRTCSCEVRSHWCPGRAASPFWFHQVESNGVESVTPAWPESSPPAHIDSFN